MKNSIETKFNIIELKCNT